MLHQWKEAAAAYRRALQADPRLPEAHFDLGVALQSQGDYAGAIAAYQAAVQLRPESADTFNNLGNCHQRLGDLPQAEAAYRRSWPSANYGGAMSNLGTVLQETGRGDEAVGLFRAAWIGADAIAHAVNLGPPSAGKAVFPKLNRCCASRSIATLTMPKRLTI